MALVIPVVKKELKLPQLFPAITKEFSTNGLSLIINPGRTLDEVVLGFRWESDMRFVRAKVKHASPMGAGFFQMGFRVTELLHVGDYPQLADLRF